MSFITRWNPFKEPEKPGAKFGNPVQKFRNPIWFEQLQREVLNTQRAASGLPEGTKAEGSVAAFSSTDGARRLYRARRAENASQVEEASNTAARIFG
jgi:hypothetical protein